MAENNLENLEPGLPPEEEFTPEQPGGPAVEPEKTQPQPRQGMGRRFAVPGMPGTPTSKKEAVDTAKDVAKEEAKKAITEVAKKAVVSALRSAVDWLASVLAPYLVPILVGLLVVILIIVAISAAWGSMARKGRFGKTEPVSASAYSKDNVAQIKMTLGNGDVSSLTLAEFQKRLELLIGQKLSVSDGFYASRNGGVRCPQKYNKTYHLGYDFPMSNGTNIYSVYPGVVSYISDNWGPGYAVWIKSDNVGISYGHLTSKADNIKEGTTIETGTLLGKSGDGHLDVKFFTYPLVGNRYDCTAIKVD